MAGSFSSLLDPRADIPIKESLLPPGQAHVVGTTLSIPFSLFDDGGDVNLTGGTAKLTPWVDGGRTPLTQITETLTSGRQIVLGDGVLTISLTAAASTDMFGAYATQRPVMTLLVTVSGQTAAIFKDCYLPLLPPRNA